jgi:hypothetical protein
LILIVFLFNVGGYYVFFSILKLQTEKELTNRLDTDEYGADEIVLLKIPVTLPYPIQTQGFERVDGSFQHEGQFYKLVKHKLQNDTLYIVCIRDHATRELVQTMDDYVELTQSFPATNQKTWNFLSKLIKDFYSAESIPLPYLQGLIVELLWEEWDSLFQEPSIPVHALPPRA